MTESPAADAAVGRRLGYLLKHAFLEVEAGNDAALAPLGIESRELGILWVIGDFGEASQQQVSQRMGIDRTTMVARIDALESKGLVSRRPDPVDRRRNVVALTARGHQVVAAGIAATDAAERAALSPLSPEEGERLRDLLVRIVPRPGSRGVARE